MKRVFEIEFPDDCGPFWMNKDNLLLCLNAYCKNTQFEVKDVTDGNDHETKQTLPFPILLWRAVTFPIAWMVNLLWRIAERKGL